MDTRSYSGREEEEKNYIETLGQEDGEKISRNTSSGLQSDVNGTMNNNKKREECEMSRCGSDSDDQAECFSCQSLSPVHRSTTSPQRHRSLSQSPATSEFEDARSEANSDVVVPRSVDEGIGIAPLAMEEEDFLVLGQLDIDEDEDATDSRAAVKQPLLGEGTPMELFNEIRRAPYPSGAAAAQSAGNGLKRRPSRNSSFHSRSHSRSHSRRISDFSDLELPTLESMFGPHLQFHPEESMTPDENDLFPSTPLDEDQLQHADNRLKEQLGSVVINTIEEEPLPEEIGWLDPRWLDPRPMMYNAAEQAEEFAMNVWHKFQSWKSVGFTNLPQFLQDNDFLRKGHRPPLPSFRECFKSIFRIHTETGNIWTHLLGVVAFLGLALYFITRPTVEIEVQEKVVFMSFFLGAIVCMGLSFTFHTVCCHQNKFIGQLFAKLDYCGIAFLTVGSFVPWLYYSFYCSYTPKVVYLVIVITLGVLAVVVSLWDKFGTPRYRPLRAGVFIFFGLSGIAPATHYSIINGWEKSINEAALGWLVLMGVLYITGALLYAFRIPERFFPGKVDILFHSHQIFHCFVIAGAFVHYHGISNMALYRLQIGECPPPTIELAPYTAINRMTDVAT